MALVSRSFLLRFRQITLSAVSSAVPSEKSVLVGLLPTLIKKATGCTEVCVWERREGCGTKSRLKILEPMNNSEDVLRGIPKVYFFLGFSCCMCVLRMLERSIRYHKSWNCLCVSN